MILKCSLRLFRSRETPRKLSRLAHLPRRFKNTRRRKLPSKLIKLTLKTKESPGLQVHPLRSMSLKSLRLLYSQKN
jgi:hypothetical protein